MGYIETWSSPRINSRAFVVHFIYIYLYINDLPLRINFVLVSILFADDTSFIISNRNFEDLQCKI